ncbi:extracellular matrix protein 1 [Heterodontus francisci]|uniref:extracellular matrix protein 1 n=1 Tax=Heterodontus francisci TaxID=7792 RepID=UPI00355B5481
MRKQLLLAHFIALTSSIFAETHRGKHNEAHQGMIEQHSTVQHEIHPPLPPFTPQHLALGHQAASGCDGSQSCHGAEGRRHRLKVAFPLGRPSAANIGDICRHLGERTTYGPGVLPSSGFGHLHRQADAVNRMEAGYAKCCHKLSEADKLACALTVWKDTLHQFCEEEFSIKTLHYSCCKIAGDKRHHCFADAALFHSYGPAAPRREEGKAAVAHSHRTAPDMRLPDVAFPPGEPNQHNVHNICRLRKIRPRYPATTLPQSGYGWLTRRATAVQQIELSYTKCCKGSEALTCAHLKWKEMLSDFCEEEFSVKDKHHHCCKMQGHQRYVCFRLEAPYPNYDREIRNISLVNVTEPVMRKLCQRPFKLLTKMPAANLVKRLQKNCCPHESLEQKVHCGVTEKMTFSAHMCGSMQWSWNDRLKCCLKNTESCFDLGYLAHIQVATMYGI